MSTTTNHAGSTSMWDTYTPTEIGEPLEQLRVHPAFVLVSFQLRETETQYGKRKAIDLWVQTTQRDNLRLYSFFSAGMLWQLERANPDDLPAVVKIDDQATPKGVTTILSRVQAIAKGADPAAIANSLPMPVLPKGNEIGDLPKSF